MEGLVGVGRRIFDHHEGRIVAGRLDAEVRVGKDALELLDPRIGVDREVEEAFDGVIFGHEGFVGNQPVADGLSELFGVPDGRLLHEGEHVEGEVPFELLAGGAQLNLLVGKLDIVK